MNRVTDYLARAEEAEAKAAKARGEYRTQLIGIAEQWRDLARQAKALAEFEHQLVTRESGPPER